MTVQFCSRVVITVDGFASSDRLGLRKPRRSRVPYITVPHPHPQTATPFPQTTPDRSQRRPSIDWPPASLPPSRPSSASCSSNSPRTAGHPQKTSPAPGAGPKTVPGRARTRSSTNLNSSARCGVGPSRRRLSLVGERHHWKGNIYR